MEVCQFYTFTCKILKTLLFIWKQVCFGFLNESSNQTCLLHGVLTKALDYHTKLIPETLFNNDVYVQNCKVRAKFLYRNFNNIFKKLRKFHLWFYSSLNLFYLKLVKNSAI